MNDIILTKWIGLDITKKLYEEHEKVLKDRFSRAFLSNIRLFDSYCNNEQELSLLDNYETDAVFSIVEGGIFASLWDLGAERQCGLTVDLKQIPIRQETVEICDFCNVNPYVSSSKGCLLISMRNGYDFIHELNLLNINAVLIGKETNSKDRVVINGEEKRFLVPRSRKSYF